MTLTIFEGIILVNLLISLWVTYQVGKVKGDIEILYEGLAITMNHVGVSSNK